MSQTHDVSDWRQAKAAPSTPHFHELLAGPHKGSFFTQAFFCRSDSAIGGVLKLDLQVGLSCDHDSSGEPIDGSELFEVIHLPQAGMTVVDVDLKNQPLNTLFPEWGQMKGAELMKALREQLPPTLLKATRKARIGERPVEITADAVVRTAQGWHLVFLSHVIHPMQDASYRQVSDERGCWSMRTHDKPVQDLPDYCKELAGKQRTMEGLTEAGKELAQVWNHLANVASQHRAARADQGITEVEMTAEQADEILAAKAHWPLDQRISSDGAPEERGAKLCSNLEGHQPVAGGCAG